MTTQECSPAQAIAVIGISGRYPGARNIAQFWKNLKAGQETISFFSDQELLDAGVSPELVSDSAFVKARPTYPRPMDFDAPFFGYTPREADVIDPQQRAFLECAWEALEDAGYNPFTFPGLIGIFGGAGMTNYLFHLLEDPSLIAKRGGLSVFTSNEKDYLATRVAYKFNLRGPSVSLQTACSTSLVGIIFACQSLLSHQTDMAMAGGVTIQPRDIGGYYYTEGGIESPDGHNRAFDASGKGTVFGSGAGLVALRRLEDAIAAGDNIYAVIRGFGMNNDGSARIGFTAPGVDGQAAVCLDALKMSAIHPETISYVECHGTATRLGDLVEITALSKAFKAFTEKKQFCAVGSVKTNIGHMDAAAGVAGFTKAVLALKHRLIPPSLHFERPNPEIDFANSPFFVNTKLSELQPTNGHPLRAAVSSFGVGGTNAHVVLEEAPAMKPTSSSRRWQLLVWSARTATALKSVTENLANHLVENQQESLADVAYTLQVGRKVFEQRSFVVCQTREEAITALQGGAPGKLLSLPKDHDTKSIAFLFPGQGSQHANMARETYENELVFRRYVDQCAEILQPSLGLDLRNLLYPEADKVEFAERELTKTHFAQPALFVVEYCLAKLWGEWGIQPTAMVGHSIGEYVAACLAGVFTLEDALRLVAARGRMMQAMPPGAMLGVLLPQSELAPLLQSSPNLSLAAVNAPSACVVSGPVDEIEAFRKKLESRDIPCRQLHTSHAFHSAMMEPMLEDFRALVSSVKLNAPQLKYLSNLTGTWATPSDATDPEYWAKHLRHTVRFSDNLAALLDDSSTLVLEVGPGRTLGSLVTQHPVRRNEQPVLASLPHPKNDPMSDLQFLMTTVGRLWLEGKALKWEAFYAQERRRRVSLPTYPFDHEKYVVEVAQRSPDQSQVSRSKILDISRWFYHQSWKHSVIWPRPAIPAPDGTCLIFMDACGIGENIAKRMRTAGWDVLTIQEGQQYKFDGSNSFVLRPGELEDYHALLQELVTQQRTPTSVFHLWNVTPKNAATRPELECFEEVLARGFMSIFHLAPAMSQQCGTKAIRLAAVTSDTYNVFDDEIPLPTKAAVVGPCRAILAECPNLACRYIDINAPASAKQIEERAEALIEEQFSDFTEDVIVYRGKNRWLQAFVPFRVESPSATPVLRSGGTYLITGGVGGIGLVLAEAIATIVPANLALFSRSPFPPRQEWDELQQGEDLTGEKIRRLLRIEELGSQVMVLSADVADLGQMTAVMSRVEERFGALSGVIHSAGVAGAGIMLLKTKAQLMNVILPKIKGTLVLEELLKNKKLDFFLLCSSLNSFVGEGGISDYIGANAFLDSFANSRRKSLNPPLAIQWDSWEDVGMVASTGGYGVPVKPVLEPLEHPFFSSCVVDGKSHTYVAHLNPEKDWVVSDHVLMGTPTLVGTTNLQFAYSAFTLAQGEGPVEMRDVLFPAPLTIKDGASREVHVVLEQGEGWWEFVVKSRDSGAQWLTHALGKIGRGQDAGPVTHDLPAIRTRCKPVQEQQEEASAGNQDAPILQFGRRWASLESRCVDTKEALGALRLPPEFSEDLAVYQLHPAMLDIATSFAIPWAGVAGANYLPFAYNRVRISGKLPATFFSHAHFEKGDSFVSLNLTLMDEQGSQLVQIDGYEVHKVSKELIEARDATLIGAGADSNPLLKSKSNKQKQAKTGARIHSTDGIEVLRRLLSLEKWAQVAVVCRDLRAVYEEVKEVFGARDQKGKPTEQKAQTMHRRPTLATEYVAPRNDLERTLVEIWEAMLGIQGIGVYDDFLELGGNSLLGIQVAARIRAEFEIELSIATFYKSPNIALLAASILESLQGGLSETELSKALDEIEAQASAHD
jgi:phthiocerol/phenolphthiocerol synthesis type-I polyketide synthase E